MGRANWDDFFGIIKNEIESQEYICNRSEVGPYSIIKKIIESINNSDLVIAVLTDMNPNVWYELGIRHSLRNGTLMLLEESQKIPFDIVDYGLIKYPKGIAISNTLKKEINSYLQKLAGNKYFDSPVLDYFNLSPIHEKKHDELLELIQKMADEQSGKKFDNLPYRQPMYNRILWVDDNPSNNVSVVKFFENKNVKFDIAINTDQGIESLKTNDYDLIITDILRGDEEDAGLNFIRKTNVLKIQIPIVVFSSIHSINKYGKKAFELVACNIKNLINSFPLSLFQNSLSWNRLMQFFGLRPAKLDF